MTTKKSKTRVVKIGSAILYCGDSLEVLPRIQRRLEAKGSPGLHACVSDPPYNISFMGRSDWDGEDGFRKSLDEAGIKINSKLGQEKVFQRWCQEWAQRLVAVLRPGAHSLTFGGTKTYHRMACGLEDAGLECRDQIGWAYGQGIPHGLNIDKAIVQRISISPADVSPRL